MIIRSQDKKRIANIGTCNLIDIIDSCNHTKHITVDGMIIGTYSTEEKAIKVLDMICEAYARCESAKELASGILFEAAKRFTQNEAEEFKKEHRANFIFQMPQDCEV